MEGIQPFFKILRLQYTCTLHVLPVLDCLLIFQRAQKCCFYQTAENLEQYCDFMEEYLNQGILETQMEREQRERYIRLLRQKLKVKTTLSTCVRLFQNLMKTGDYVQAEEILGLMDQKWHRKEEFWILKIRYLAERKKGAELQQCLRQMKEEQIYLSSKSKEALAFWLD